MRFSEWIKSQLDALRAMVSSPETDGQTTDTAGGPAVAEQKSSDRLSLKFKSDPANLSVVRKAIEQFCAAAGLDVPACEEVGLVVNEALANVIRHAYHGAKDKPIETTVVRIAQGVTIAIRDWGNGVDPSKQAPREHDPMSPGGIGLICMSRLMDNVTYTPQEDGGILLQMTRITSGSKAAGADCEGDNCNRENASAAKSG